MGEKAREVFLAGYTRERMQAAYLDLYAELIREAAE